MKLRYISVVGLVTMGAVVLGVSGCSAETPRTPDATSTTLTAEPTEAPEHAPYSEVVKLTEHGIRVGNAAAETKLQIIGDHQCPYCKDLSDGTSEALTAAIDAGDISVEYFVTDFLNDRSYGEWSLTAANALNVVAHAEDNSQWQAAYLALYEMQPTSEDEIVTVDEIIEAFEGVGISLSEHEQEQIRTDHYEKKIDGDTEYAFSLGIEYTPSVLVGDTFEPVLSNPESFSEFLLTGVVPEEEAPVEE